MCRAKDETGVRCLVHSAEGKAEARAADSHEDDFCTWYDAIEKRHAELSKAKTDEESETVLSRWMQIVSNARRAWDQATVRLREKRDALAKRRAEHYAAKVAAVKNAEKRAAAEEAVRNAEAAQLEFEAAEDAHEEARCMEIRTRPMDGFCSPKAIAQWDHSLAMADAEDARGIRDQAWAKLKPIDDQPDPKTGTPTRRKLAYLSAQRDCESTARIETYLEGVAKNIPEHSEAVTELSAAEARLAAAKRNLEQAKAGRHSSLSMGRPPAEAEVAA